MNKLLLKLFLFLSGLIFLLSCGRYDTQKVLDDVESYIMERPDSALSVLDSMDRSLLISDRLKAHHALLHAMALDKNYIDVTDDSLAGIAVEYYSRKGPEKYEARALYYLGLSYYYAGEYNKAILEFTKAEKIAEKSDSLYWGFTKVLQSKTYSKTYNDVEALKCLELANIIYKNLGEEYYLKVSELYLSQAFCNNGRSNEAKEMLREIVSDNNTDKKLKASAIISYAFINVVGDNPDFNMADELYSKLTCEYDSSLMSYKDYWAWAYSLCQLKRNSESQILVDQLMENDTSGTADFWMYMIEKSKGNLSSTLKYLENSTTKTNLEVTEVLKQSLILSQRDYFESQAETYYYKERSNSLALICVAAISTFMILILLFLFFRYIRVREEEKEKLLQYADEISRQLAESRDEHYPVLKKKYMDLYRSKFETIGYLYEQYILLNGKNDADKILFDKVAELLEGFRSSYEETKAFEDILNRDLNNIMLNFRKEITGLKEIDYRILSFALVGFDVTTISHLLNTSMNAVYIRKSRMRRLIEEQNPVHKSAFLEILNWNSSV